MTPLHAHDGPGLISRLIALAAQAGADATNAADAATAAARQEATGKTSAMTAVSAISTAKAIVKQANNESCMPRLEQITAGLLVKPPY